MAQDPKEAQKVEYPKLEFKEARENYMKKFKEPTISFKLTEKGSIDAKLETQRLIFLPATMDDVDDFYNECFSIDNVMKYFATGKTSPKENVIKRVESYHNRWQNGYPFSAFKILLNDNELKKRNDKIDKDNNNNNNKKIENKFIGFVISGDSDEDNSSEVAYILNDKHWGNGYGYEALGCISLFYIPFIIKHENPKFYGNRDKKQIIKRIVATSNIDNIASSKLLSKCGFHTYKDTEKFGFKRHEWELVLK